MPPTKAKPEEGIHLAAAHRMFDLFRTEISDLIDAVRNGETEKAAHLHPVVVDLGRAYDALVREQARLTTMIDGQGGLRDRQELDLDAARRDISGRLARLRERRDETGVSGQSGAE